MSAKTNVSFRTVWGVCMALAYTGIACVVLFTPLLLRYNGANGPQLPDENAALRIVLGIVFLVYGLMRGYSTWMKFKANDQ